MLPAPPMSTSHPSVRALIVLADPVLASTLTSALAHQRVHVVGPFPTADEALIALLHRSHLVAILDLALPSAWALARMLEHWDVPYLAVGNGPSDVEGTPLAPTAALELPVAPHDMLEAILTLINATSASTAQHERADHPS